MARVGVFRTSIPQSMILSVEKAPVKSSVQAEVYFCMVDARVLVLLARDQNEMDLCCR